MMHPLLSPDRKGRDGPAPLVLDASRPRLIEKLMTPPWPAPLNNVNPYPHNTRPATIEAPPPTLSGAWYAHRVLPLEMSSAVIVPLSVPTKAAPATALTGPKTLPAK